MPEFLLWYPDLAWILFRRNLLNLLLVLAIPMACQAFPGQGLNWHHSSDSNHSNDKGPFFLTHLPVGRVDRILLHLAFSLNIIP